MIVLFGQRLYGKTHRVRGLCHVQTKFFHLNYVPLIPVASYAIVEGTEASGSKIPLCGSSVLLTWLRVILGGLAFWGVLCASRAFGFGVGEPVWVEGEPLIDQPLTGMIVGAVSLVAFFCLWHGLKPSRARALELGEYLNVERAYVESCLGARGAATPAEVINGDLSECARCLRTGRVVETAIDRDGFPTSREVPCPECGGRA
jgi:hypothetical protein